MIAVQMTSSKDFMGKLLATDCFYDFLLLEAQVVMANTYTIDGHIQKEFYSKEEWEEQEKKGYLLATWEEIQDKVFSVIKGKHSPVRFQILLQVKPEKLQSLLGEEAEKEIGALLCNVRFENGKIQLVSGVTYKGFTMNKEPEHIWDAYLKSFLTQRAIAFEEEV